MVGSANSGCILRLRLALLAGALCAATGCVGSVGFAPRGIAIATAPPPSAEERYCAWYGDAADGVLYFGQAPFWSAMRAAGGEPRADLAREGPQLVGRFDLARERLLAPLEVGAPGRRSGVWDVHAGEQGWLYFSTFFEPAGRVHVGTGEVQHFDALGLGLNELARGPGGSLIVTRYGSGDGETGDGSLLAFAPWGEAIAELRVPAPAGYRSAPKTPAWDGAREELWSTTDLLPVDAPGAEDRHDAYRLAPDGRVLERIADRELQFVVVDREGRRLSAELAGRTLSLVIAESPPAAGARTLVLDRAFPVEHDFVQDLKVARDGRIALTRWSGVVHVVDGSGVRTLQLPRLAGDGLYYTAVLHGERVCATHCADVSVVCTDLPADSTE